MVISSPVRLVVAERSENRAHEVDSLLRDSGVATRMEFCADPASLESCLAGHEADLLLFNADLPDLETALPKLRSANPELPILLLESGDLCPENLTHGLALGATDVVSTKSQDRLMYVVRRELRHLCRFHQLAQARKALDESQRRCELLLENSNTAIAYVHEGMHIYTNDDYLKLFGFQTADDLLGVPLLDLVVPAAQDDFKNRMKSFRSCNQETQFAFTGHTKSGAPIEGNMTLAAAVYDDEVCTQVLLKACKAEAPPLLKVSPSADINTPADNMAPSRQPDDAGVAAERNGTFSHQGAEAFIRQVETLFLENENAETHAVILLAKLDNYTLLQQQHGLLAAEQTFRQVADILRPEAESYLFSALSDHCYAFAKLGVQEADADHVAKTMRRQVEACLLNVAEKTVRCTLTICGVVVEGFETVADCTNYAFRALLDAHKAEKQNTVLWQSVSCASATNEDGSELTAKQRRTLELIENAIKNHSFMLLFQPIISLRGDSDEHYEVFLRLQDKEGNQLAPHEFLQLAKEQKVAGKIDRWVILQSIKMLSRHRAKGNNTRLTINLTSNSLTDKEFLQWLEVAIKAARLPTDAVIFQITEADATSYLRHASAFIEGMKKLHCRTSLSRFGVEANCFELLDHIHVDYVKLEGALLENLDNDQARRNRFTDVIKKLQANGKLTIVPMVESASVLSALWQAGANYIQGYYLQEPSSEMNYDFTTDE